MAEQAVLRMMSFDNMTESSAANSEQRFGRALSLNFRRTASRSLRTVGSFNANALDRPTDILVDSTCDIDDDPRDPGAPMQRIEEASDTRVECLLPNSEPKSLGISERISRMPAPEHDYRAWHTTSRHGTVKNASSKEQVESAMKADSSPVVPLLSLGSHSREEEGKSWTSKQSQKELDSAREVRSTMTPPKLAFQSNCLPRSPGDTVSSFTKAVLRRDDSASFLAPGRVSNTIMETSTPTTGVQRWKGAVGKIVKNIRAVDQENKESLLGENRSSLAFDLCEIVQKFIKNEGNGDSGVDQLYLIEEGLSATEHVDDTQNCEKVQTGWLQRTRCPQKCMDVMSCFNSRIPVMDPDHWRRRSWDCLILVLVIYSAIAVPLELGFAFDKPTGMVVADYIIDLLFLIDIAINFRTAYHDNRGHIVIETRKIALHYFRGWFLIDLFASIPFELLIFATGQIPGSHVAALALLKAPRLLRLGRLMRFFERNAATFMRNANIVSIVKLLGSMCLLAHWTTCFWHFLSCQFSSLTWMFDVLGTDDGPDVSPYFLGYWSAVNLMVGESITPQNNIEAVFCVFTLIMGACFMAVIVGNMAMLVSNMNATSHRITTLKERVADTARYLGVSQEVQGRIREYFDYLGGLSHPGHEMMETLSVLPPGLYGEVCESILSSTIRNILPFSKCEEAFVSTLLQRVQMVVSMPGETVYCQGEPGLQVVFVLQGRVAVTVDGNMVDIKDGGSWFGEASLLDMTVRTHSAISVTPTDLLMLHRDDIRDVMKQYPHSAEILKGWASDMSSSCSRP